ncbi:SMI1/KNR4 family protein [Streptomyces sp. NPDC047737]|uniref:SMI1/KNR4 family protein n=1 Tax=Streptomyces sp. NPDC047737 TaxID=3155740 RepID=UPI0033E57A6D
MTDALARIAERVRPPAVVVDGQGDWAEAERVLGTRLPEDYKQLVAAYGRGDFWGALCLRTPFGESNPVPLTADLLDDYGPLREDAPEDYPYPLFPEPGGLLAWAVTESAAHVCWLTEGPPDAWPVVIWSRDDDYERFDCGAGAFLDGLTSRRITSHLLHHAPELTPWFDPAVEMDHVYVKLGRRGAPVLRAAGNPARGAGPHVGPWRIRAPRAAAGPFRRGRQRLAHDVRVRLRPSAPGRVPARRQRGGPAGRAGGGGAHRVPRAVGRHRARHVVLGISHLTRP